MSVALLISNFPGKLKRLNVMSSSELLAVRDKDFSSHNVEYFKEILDQDDMTDVTIACDDNYTMRAHKVILSASSLFFRSVIKKSKCPDPYIYLKGVPASHLSSLMSYIYSGETDVRTEDFQMFMTIASELKISSLTSTNHINSDDRQTLMDTEVPRPDTKISHEKNRVKKKLEKPNPEEPKSELPSAEKESESGFPFDDFDLHEDNNIDDDNVNGGGESKQFCATFDKSISEETDKVIELLGRDGRIVFSCTICKKTSLKRMKARIHAETHLNQFRHKCPDCGLESKTSSSLYVHMRRKHPTPASDIENKAS